VTAGFLRFPDRLTPIVRTASDFRFAFDFHFGRTARVLSETDFPFSSAL